MEVYDSKIEQRLYVKDQDIDIMDVPQWNRLSTNEDDPDFWDEFEKVINDEGIPEADNTSLELEDSYINMEICLPKGSESELLHAMVKQRILIEDRKPVGTGLLNLITDT